MPVMCFRIKAAYFPVPKVACTSVKLALFQIDHGFDIHDVVGEDSENFQIHLWHPTQPYRPEIVRLLPEGTTKFTIVRDPVARFLSGYRNRIMHLGDAERSGLPLPGRPDIDTFVKLLPEYRKAPIIAHHFAPQTTFLGNDLYFYDRVFSIDRLDELTTFLSEAAAAPVVLPRAQQDGPAMAVDDIKPETLAAIRDIYAGDYDLIGRWTAMHGLPPLTR